MARALLISMGMALLTSSCMTLSSPSEPGIAAYRNGDTVAAFTQLAPLAKSNDPTAQYFAARIILEKQPPPSHSEQQKAIAWVLASAGAGNSSAYSLALALAMAPQKRESFLNSISIESVAGFNRSASSRSGNRPVSATRMTYSEDTVRMAEDVAGGPVIISTVLELAQNLVDMQNGVIITPETMISDTQLLQIDQQRAKLGDQYAQSRLGARYSNGRGVSRDDNQAFGWRLKAAKSRPAPRNCIYQAPVGNSGGSTYCYNTGQPIPGLPLAMLEVCKSYASGIGTAKNLRKAREWCLRALNDPATMAEADDTLRNLD